MRKIDLNDFSQWSPWPSRLLGLTEWNVPSRTIEKVDQEYDKDKYAKCLTYYLEAGSEVTIEEVKQFEFGLPQEHAMCVSHGNDLALMTLGEVRAEIYQLMVETMRHEINKSLTVLELGCGYGYNLWMLKQHFPSKYFLGGELSTKAICLAANMFQNDSEIEVSYLNLYDSIYDCLDRVQPPITIFTSHAIEQLHDSAPVFEALMHHREKIMAVFHFEPVFELHDTTLIGLMRRRYAEVNDYNLDLLSQLKRRSGHIHVIKIEANVLSLNPINSTSIVNWEFVL